MGLKLNVIFLLAIIGFETAHGGKMLKKLKKELGYKLEDYLEANTWHVNAFHDAINLRHNIPVYPSDCTCHKMTVWQSGPVESHHGEYVESTLVNGHPSWISGGHAIWYTDDNQVLSWVMGDIVFRGGKSNVIGMYALGKGLGAVCPWDVASWREWNGSQWVTISSSAVAFTCTQAKGANSSMVPHEYATQD